MKLNELRTRDIIDWPGVGGGNATHMTAAQGYTMDLEQGVVTVTSRTGAVRMVPLSNVAWMSPVPRPGPVKAA
jgi:hypothetical protein